MENKSIDIEKDWDEFWKDICCPNGVLDLQQVKRELSDFHFIIQQVPKVYRHITGGKLSKGNYYADAVIEEADDTKEREWQDYLEEETQSLKDRIKALREAFQQIISITPMQNGLGVAQELAEEALKQDDGLGEGK